MSAYVVDEWSVNRSTQVIVPRPLRSVNHYSITLEVLPGEMLAHSHLADCSKPRQPTA